MSSGSFKKSYEFDYIQIELNNIEICQYYLQILAFLDCQGSNVRSKIDGFFNEEYSPIEKSPVQLLMEEIKPVITEKYEFEYGDL